MSAVGRVGFICQWYPPEPVMLPAEFPQGLKEVGWDVRVLTGYPNYPGGKVHPGYTNVAARRETLEGLPVLRTPLYPSHDRSAVRRALNYLTWAASATVSSLSWLARTDVNLVYGSPITAAIPAFAQKRLRGTPYVIQVQDLWPDSIFQSGFADRLPGPINRLLVKACDRIYREAAACVVISPGMAQILSSRGVSPERIHLIYNWAKGDSSPLPPATSGIRAKFGIAGDDRVLVYAGNLGPAQGLAHWIEAAKGIDGCHLVLIGDGIDKAALRDEATRLGAMNVHFHDPVASGEIQGLVSDADAQLVSLVDRTLFKVTMPSKLQAALASAAPVVVSVGGDASAVVAEAEAGVITTPDDISSMRSALLRFRSATKAELRQWGLNGRAYYDARMSKDAGLAALNGVLIDAMEQQKEQT